MEPERNHMRKAHPVSFVESVIVALKRVRITINPYYVFIEGLFDGRLPELQTRFEGYSIGSLTTEDMKTISRIPGRKVTLQQLMKRLDDGNMCFGMKHSNELVAFTWYDLNESNIKGRKVSLKKNEAYLFDAYTLVAYRGKGIAPYMRYQVYRELVKLGKTKLYSFSDYFNPPAIKFKQKLNAKYLELRIIVGFRRWRFSVLLNSYNVQV